MSTKRGDSPISKLGVFSKNLPSASGILLVLLIISIGTGIGSAGIIDHTSLSAVLVVGSFTGLMVVLLPTVLTAVVIKTLKRHVLTKYLLFISLIGAIVYSVTLLLASGVYAATGNFSLANAVVLVGDASIFGWWFFVSKVLFAQKKKANLYAVIQPVLNILVYVAAGLFIFTFSEPLSILLVKLSAGIFVFLVVSYLILFMFDNPIKRTLGFGGIDAFSEMVQNWLFDVDISVAGSGAFGLPYDIDVHTLTFRRKNGSIKAMLFAPWLHYGPVGTLGGSNFPFMLERYAQMKYKASAVVMHSAVNEDNNPVSSSQIAALRKAFDRTVSEGKKITNGKDKISFARKAHNGAVVSVLAINNVSLATFTRAPRVTEDIHPEARRLFKELLERDGGDALLIDAHNCRYGSAPETELEGVRSGSKSMNDYIAAIKSREFDVHRSRKLKVGVSNIDIYNKLQNPIDIAPGNINVTVFGLDGFRFAMIQFNANNMLPSFRTSVIEHVKKLYGIDVELYTTDTHYVNNIRNDASNVLGRHTGSATLMPYIDKALDEALSNMEQVDVYYKKDIMQKFRIWGPGVRQKAFATINSVVSIAKVLVPAVIAIGFIIASWLIFLV